MVSDVTGVTGMAIIKAILAGERDPAALARLRDRRGQQDEATIARALQGSWRAEHLFARKYFLSDSMVHDGSHAWVRLRPRRQYTWDFRKLQ